MRDSTYVGASFFATVAGLNRNPRAPCHVLIQAGMDDFSGLCLVLRGPGTSYKSLYVAGVDGSGTTESGMLETTRVTRGRMLSDSLGEVKTGNSTTALRGAGDRSPTDALTEVFRIDFRTVTFHLISSCNQTTPLNKFIN